MYWLPGWLERCFGFNSQTLLLSPSLCNECCILLPANLFSKLHETCLVYFDPINIIFYHKIIYCSGDLTNTSAITNVLATADARRATETMVSRTSRPGRLSVVVGLLESRHLLVVVLVLIMHTKLGRDAQCFFFHIFLLDTLIRKKIGLNNENK